MQRTYYYDSQILAWWKDITIINIIKQMGKKNVENSFKILHWSTATADQYKKPTKYKQKYNN
jgi:hypothetical protein